MHPHSTTRMTKRPPPSSWDHRRRVTVGRFAILSPHASKNYELFSTVGALTVRNTAPRHGASPRARTRHPAVRFALQAAREPIEARGTHPRSRAPSHPRARDLSSADSESWPNTRNTGTSHRPRRSRGREAADLTKKSARSSPVEPAVYCELAREAPRAAAAPLRAGHAAGHVPSASCDAETSAAG